MYRHRWHFALVCSMYLSVVASGASGQPSSKGLEFEAASIRDSSVARTEWQPGNGTIRGNLTIPSLVQFAYKTNSGNIVGLPGWTTSAYYDIRATAHGGFTQEQMQEMEQNLLAKRFKFSAHWTTAVHSGYALRRVAGSAKRPQSSDASSPLDGMGAMRMSSTGMIAHGATMSSFSAVLGIVLGEAVENETDLDGGYEFALTFARPNRSAAPRRSDQWRTLNFYGTEVDWFGTVSQKG